MNNKQVIGVAQVLQQLKDGMTRDDIKDHYGISTAECKLLFQHKDLKGRKTIKVPTFVIVDDATLEADAVESKTEPKKELEVVADSSVEDTTIPDTELELEEEVEEVELEEEVETEKAKATWD